ncbi:MAG: glycosyltransferase family 4 protein [Acidimicrobiia bacterium]
MLIGYALVLAVCGLVTAVTTPLVRRMAWRYQIVVAPDERRVHERPTPAVGGLAMLVGVLAGLGAAWASGRFDDVFSTRSGAVGIAVAAVVVVVVGFVDELRKVHGEGVSAPAKTAGIVLAGGILSLAGVSTIFFRVPLVGVYSLSPDFSAFITVVWVLVLANAINLIDGLDGLAAGVCAIAAGAFFLYSLRLDDVGVLSSGNIGPLIAVLVLGVCLGFLPFNFHPARIFMGDCGALLLGVLMAASTMSVGGSTDTFYSGQSYFFFAPLLIPVVILGVPILDTAWAIVRRARSRSGLATADKEHLHHQLMRLGHGHRRSVVILWAWTGVLSATVLVPVYTERGYTVLPIGVLGVLLLLYSVLHPSVRAARAVGLVAVGPGDGQRDGGDDPAADAEDGAATGSGDAGDGGPEAGGGGSGDDQTGVVDLVGRPRRRAGRRHDNGRGDGAEAAAGGGPLAGRASGH